jgi:hypothetical protein
MERYGFERVEAIQVVERELCRAAQHWRLTEEQPMVRGCYNFL